MNTAQKQHAGHLYDPGDPEVMVQQLACLEKLYEFNQTRPSELEKRTAMLKEMFAEIGENCYIEPPLRPISEHDREVYFKDRPIPAEFFEK